MGHSHPGRVSAETLRDNDARLQEPRWDYFDELLKRIRDIRASKKRFYQKVRDLFTLAEDYRANEQDTAKLFAEVQNNVTPVGDLFPG